MDSYAAGLGTVANVQSRRGRELRQDREYRFPKVFLAYDKGASEIFGAFVMERCFKVVNEPGLTFIGSGFCMLAVPFPISTAMCKYKSCLLALKHCFGQQVRSAGAFGCDALGHHFLAHAGSQWQVWACSAQQRSALSVPGGEEVCIHTPETWARSADVHLEHVEQLVRSAAGGIGSAVEDPGLCSDEDEHEGGDVASGAGPQNPERLVASGVPAVDTAAGAAAGRRFNVDAISVAYSLLRSSSHLHRCGMQLQRPRR